MSRPALIGLAIGCCAAVAGCGDDGQSPRASISTGDASVESAVVRCGTGPSASSEPCPGPAECIAIPSACQDDSPWVMHDCRFRSECRDRGNGEPYCISTGAGVGCRCVQRCWSHDQCEPGSQCVCEPGKYGRCMELGADAAAPAGGP